MKKCLMLVALAMCVQHAAAQERLPLYVSHLVMNLDPERFESTTSDSVVARYVPWDELSDDVVFLGAVQAYVRLSVFDVEWTPLPFTVSVPGGTLVLTISYAVDWLIIRFTSSQGFPDGLLELFDTAAIRVVLLTPSPEPRRYQPSSN